MKGGKLNGGNVKPGAVGSADGATLGSGEVPGESDGPAGAGVRVGVESGAGVTTRSVEPGGYATAAPMIVRAATPATPAICLNRTID